MNSLKYLPIELNWGISAKDVRKRMEELIEEGFTVELEIEPKDERRAAKTLNGWLEEDHE